MPKKVRKRPMQKFTVRFAVTMEIKLSKRLIKEVLKPDWQASFYKLRTPQEIATHVAYNLARGSSLCSLDGFAHLEEADAVVDKESWDED